MTARERHGLINAMAVPGLASHIVFEEHLEPRLINRTTGGMLLVTTTEAELLRSWDGSTSATRLSAAVFMKGVDIEPWQIEQFFARLERLGCLATGKPSIPNFVSPPPGFFEPGHAVPKMRGDLLIVKVPRSRAVFHVKDPISNRAFSLFDTEVTVARMLDGHRTAQQIIDNAAKLGIDVTLEALQRFVTHLKGYRFIDQDIQEGSSTWPARKQWTEEERQLYQASMKNLREGHFAEALSFAESLEAANPESPEARELKHRVEVEREGVVELICSFSAMHEREPRPAAPSSPDPMTASPDEGPAAEHSALAQLPRPAWKAFVAEHPRLVAGVAAGLVLLLVLVHPVTVSMETACELQVETLGVPRTMRGGKVGAVDVQPGATVAKGAVLARLGVRSLDEVNAKLTELEAKLKALPPPGTGKKADAARAAVKKAEGAVAALEKNRKKGSKAQQAATEKKLVAKKKELDGARKKLDALAADPARTKLEAELAKQREQKSAVEAELANSIVIAPTEGVFVSIGPLPEELGVNGTFGQIVAPKFKLVTREPLPERVETVIFRAPAVEAELGVVDGKPDLPVRAALVGAKGTLEVTLGRKPWIATWF